LKPTRELSPNGTYFITATTAQGRSILQSDRMATLFVQVLQHYESLGRFVVHEYVVMPNHFHLLVTPAPGITIERALQLVKGGFSFRAARELNFKGEIWQRGFTDHRIRSDEDYELHRRYIHMNPVKRGLVPRPENFPYSSANPSAAKADLIVTATRHE
jgi:putative transposase